MNNNLLPELESPAKTKRQQLTYCNANKPDMEKWLNELSLLNMADISKQIRTTLTELSELHVEEQKRLELMELMRVAINNLITSLSKHYVNQAVVLDNKAINVAQFVQQLRAQCFSIYSDIANQLFESKKSSKSGLAGLLSKFDSKKDISLAIHRALSEAAGLLYETKLLYLPDVPGIWGKLHGLYHHAQSLKILDAKFSDPIGNFGQILSIYDVFMRSILLSIGRTNRLRQSEIKKLYQYSELWAPLIKSSKSPEPNDLFLIDLGSTKPPMYITTSTSLSGNILYINASKLLNHLKNLKHSKDTGLLHDSERNMFNSNMVDFVSNSIEEPLERHFSRHPYEGKLKTCVGLLGTHYHIAGKRQFADVIQLKHLMKQSQEAEILIDKSRYMHDGDLMFNQIDDGPKIDRSMMNIYEIDILDMSPGGYRLEWQGISAPTLRTGEILCLKEQDGDKWQVGIIRWVQQNPGVGAEFGIEVMSSKATACGVKPSRAEDSDSNYMRAIILPEVKSLNRAATLITPNFHFKKDHRVKIRVGTEEVIAQIGKEHISTQSFNQYDFTVLPNTAGKTIH